MDDKLTNDVTRCNTDKTEDNSTRLTWFQMPEYPIRPYYRLLRHSFSLQ